MRRIVLCLCFASLPAWSLADTEFLGLFLNGAKVGYSSSKSVPKKEFGADTRIDNYNLINLGLLGQDMTIEIVSQTWTAKGKPVRMTTSTSSAGRVQKVVAIFRAGKIDLEMDSSGAKSKKSLPLPKDAPVVDDAITAILEDGPKAGTKKAYYVLDPMTASLVKNTVTVVGKTKLQWRGKTYDCQAVEMTEPRAVTTAYFSSKGDLIKIDGPMGMEMVPMAEAEAKSLSNSKVPDLADETKIKPDKEIPDPSSLESLKLRVTGRDLSLLPSDHRQTVAKEGESWTIETKVEKGNRETTIAASAAAQAKWTKEGMNVPAADASMIKLSKSIIGNEKLVIPASERVRQYVLKVMRPNAGIGVLRDAREVLKSKEGVCRDYAVLTATLLRASNIPARLASGLVYQDGEYYYHAWAEVWDGSQWIGVDSTRPGSVGVGHITLAQGSVEDAFTFPFLGKVKMEVLDARGKRD